MDALIVLEEIRDGLRARPQLLAEARTEGHTWAAIAAAAGMTRQGVEKALRNAGIEPTALKPGKRAAS